ncbi:PREDICTED: uncharacterized protein LOC109467133 [Branchiostoma belcheri]|uniref:Uncharacterized protein LOC109467133 n=1 Tax=Branchiostoma belcheri TaxID=7741 RepID=A0A6P4YPM7_BRABE|nr:PREDICTED: uncharacterized protein LOC109467133 [Branchiostoma belcheri]
MAEDLTSDVVPNVVRNDSFSDSTTKPGTRTVPPTVRQTDEGENEHDDDEHLSIQSDAAFENRETVHISPGDFDTYAIAYTCKTYDTCIKKNVEETKSKPFQGSNTASSSHNDNDIDLAGCGSVQNYTDTFNGIDGRSSVPAFSTVSNTTRRQVTQKWRDDYRCGDGYTTGDGRTAECDPDSIWPCCSSANWCGNTAAHCDCAGCVDHRNTESGDRKLENIITIGGNGKEPIVMAYGVAVSADNEIFVTSFKGVQVFSINGKYLRHFHTTLPGKNGVIMPYDVAIGIEPGHLWVVGVILKSGAKEGHVQVVTYSRSGQAMKTFDVGFTRPSHPSPPVIAIDVRNNKIIVGQGKTVKMFDPDGSLYRSFKVLSGSQRGMIGGVTSDSEGNILLTLTHKAIEIYSKSGVKIFEFAGRGKGQMNYGICLDKFGNIIVADNENHRVDMFTSRGKFVRTIAKKDPSGIAMGPDGEMVVTSAGLRSTVTIFPRHMVLP